MNAPDLVNEDQAEQTLRTLLRRMESVSDIDVARQVMSSDTAIDLIVSFRRGKAAHTLLVEVKANAEPARV